MHYYKLLDIDKCHQLSLPLSFFHKCFPVAHLWPFQNPSLCTFLFLQPTHYEQQDLGGLSETTQRKYFLCKIATVFYGLSHMLHLSGVMLYKNLHFRPCLEPIRISYMTTAVSRYSTHIAWDKIYKNIVKFPIFHFVLVVVVLIVDVDVLPCWLQLFLLSALLLFLLMM